MKIKTNNKKGFTLLETLISIFILTLAITGPVYIASVSFRTTIDSRDGIVAQYLAEEVVEVLRNRRDERVLATSTKNWFSDTTSSITENSSENVDCLNENGDTDDLCVMLRDPGTNDYIFEQCAGGECPNMPLNTDSANNIIYGDKDVANTSKFVREFYFEKKAGDPGDVPMKEINLIVNIRWENRGQEKKYTLRERLYELNYNRYFKDTN